MVVLWGENLGPRELVEATPTRDGKQKQAVAGTRVLFNGTPATLVYTSNHQVSAVAPNPLPPGAVTVQAEYQGLLSTPFVIPTAAVSPGVFTLDASGRGAVVAWNEDGTVNTPDAPAAPGTVVAFYLTGLGRSAPAPAGEASAPPVKVLIGGAEARVEYAGPAPGMGNAIFQVNARVPYEAVSGSHVFLSVEVGGMRSQPGVTLAVTATGNRLPEPPGRIEVSRERGRVMLAWPGPLPEPVLSAHLERATGAADPYREIAVLPAERTTYLDASVAPSTKYYYRLRLETAAGYTRYSPPVAVDTLPQPPAPDGLRAAHLPDGRVRLEWSTTGAAGAILVERRSPSGSWLQVASVPAQAGSFHDRGLAPATRYSYRVRAETFGGLSAYSAEAAIETPDFVAEDGPPRIHPADGRRLYWNGATWYPVGYYPANGALTSDQTDYANFYRDLLDRLAENRINYMRAVFNMGQPYGDAMTVYERTGPGLAADGRPKFDLTRFNRTYFDYWRSVAEYALSKGIVLQISITDLWHNHDTIVEVNGPGRIWGMQFDFYRAENNINGIDAADHTAWMSETHPVFAYHQALIRKLVDTMGDLPNIVWEIGNQTGRTDWELRLADFLTAYEQSRGLPVRLVMPRDLPGHQFVPGQCVWDPVQVHSLLVGAYGWNLPLLADNDCIYPGDPDTRRRRAWAALTAGAHINLFHLELASPAVLDSRDAADGMRYLGYLRTFLEELDVDLAGMRPSDGLVTHGWAYARPGREYIIYLISGGGTTVRGLPAAYSAVWFNPRDGRTRSAGGGPTFIAPDDRDWVLYIRGE